MKKYMAAALVFVVCIGLYLFFGGKQENAVSDDSTTNSAVVTTNNIEKIPQDTITLVIAAEPATLDPASANADAITIVLNFIMENLFELGPDGIIFNELMDTYEFETPTTLKCKIKEGVKFSTGTELTTDDILWEFERLQKSPKSASHFSFIDIENSKIIDKYNMVLKFKQAWAPFSNTLSTGRGSLVSKAAFEEMGEDSFARNPIGTGPYKLEEWVSGTHIKLTRNEYYHGEPAKTENIIIKFIPESTSRVIELETGGADIAYYIEGSDIQRVNDIEGCHIEQGDSYRYFTVVLSMQEEFFKDIRVREAMAFAIDKVSLTNAVTNGVGTPLDGYCPPIMDGYIKTEPIPYDVDKAKELMKEAGYENGFSIDLHVQPEPIYERIAEAIQAYWFEIGIKANIVSSALATYEAQHNGKFQASVRDGTATEISNVFIIYESSFGSRMNGNDDKLDRMLIDLRKLYYGDPKREEALKEITAYLDSIHYTYPFMSLPTVYGVSDKLEGFVFHPAEDHMTNFTQWVVYK